MRPTYPFYLLIHYEFVLRPDDIPDRPTINIITEMHIKMYIREIIGTYADISRNIIASEYRFIRPMGEDWESFASDICRKIKRFLFEAHQRTDRLRGYEMEKIPVRFVNQQLQDLYERRLEQIRQNNALRAPIPSS